MNAVEQSGDGTLLLSRTDVENHVEMPAVVNAVETAFASYDSGRARMPAKTYVDVPGVDGDFRAMPAYLETEEWRAAGIKWVNVHPGNPAQADLPTVMALVVYADPDTGVPLAIMDGTTLTRFRTGAAAGVATDHLAVEDASSLGILGAGEQAYAQLEAISTVRPIEEVVVCDRDDAAATRFVEAADRSFAARRGTISDAAACDVLSTITPVEDPIVSRDDLGPRTHVNAMGADAPGKQELDEAILRDARVVVDDHEQATHSGELNVSYAAGRIDDDDIFGTIGEVVTEDRSGRESHGGPTVFDSTGLAIQDIATARLVYRRALETDSQSSFGFLE